MGLHHVEKDRGVVSCGERQWNYVMYTKTLGLCHAEKDRGIMSYRERQRDYVV